MTSTRRAYCPECGAQLRRGQPIGALCDPCQHGGPDPRQVLPADFYDQARIVAPLGAYDFGVFFRWLRTQADWSQQTLGTVVDMHQAQISAIERGAHRLRDIETVARIVTRLVIPPVRLGFPDIRATVFTGVTNQGHVKFTGCVALMTSSDAPRNGEPPLTPPLQPPPHHHPFGANWPGASRRPEC
ncbi:MAG: helix-turn-helix domain-containing protein [Pseudonocardiales bacterium]